MGQIAFIRDVRTACATFALIMSVLGLGTGLPGWLASPLVGVVSLFIAASTLLTLWFVWQNINVTSDAVSKLS